MDLVLLVGTVIPNSSDHSKAVILQIFSVAELHGQALTSFTIDLNGDYEVGFEPVLEWVEHSWLFEIA